MNLVFKKKKDNIIVYLSGSMDTSVSKAIEEDFEEILSQYPDFHIILNMKDLKYLSSSGLRTIVSLRSLLSDKGKQLKICNMGRSVRDIFEMTKVISFFKVFPDEESAILSLNQMDENDFE